MPLEDKEKAFAYLEKQKEYDPVEDGARTKIISRATTEKQVVLISESNGNAEIGWDTRSLEDTKKLLELGIAFINKQLGTSPAEWSEDYREEDLRTRFAFYTYKDEEDVLYLSNVFVEETSRNKGFGTKILAAAEKVAEILGAINIRLKVKQNSPANAWYRKNGYGYMTFEGDYDWLEKTLEYLKPNKQKWSEDIIRKAVKEVGLTQHQIDWFKTNVFSPKQEWSEEDEQIFNHIIYCAENRGWIPFNEIDWLKSRVKSLRPQPHWKPIEEHLQALRRAIKKADVGSDTERWLNDLYNDLKKL
jgi:GNAT superfamily N-acetyltransferase